MPNDGEGDTAPKAKRSEIMIARGKRVLSLMLVLCMLILLLPVSVLADGVTHDNLWVDGVKPDIVTSVTNGYGGNEKWTDATIGSDDCIKSTVSVGGYYSTLKVVFTVPTGETRYVKFDYAVSCNEDSYFKFWDESGARNNPILKVSDDTASNETGLDWKTVQYAYGAGQHELYFDFYYVFGESTNGVLQTAYLKNLGISEEAEYAAGYLTLEYDSELGEVYVDGQYAEPNTPTKLLAYHSTIKLEAKNKATGAFQEWTVLDNETGQYKSFQRSDKTQTTYSVEDVSKDYTLKAEFKQRRPVNIVASDYNDEVATLFYKAEETNGEYVKLEPLQQSQTLLSQQKISFKVVPKEEYVGNVYCADVTYKKPEDTGRTKTVKLKDAQMVDSDGLTFAITSLPDNGGDTEYIAVINLNVATTELVDVENFKAEGVENIQTHGHLPWTLTNGEYSSGNKNIQSSLSVLKLDLKGSGTLVFDYKVSSETSDTLYFVTGEEPTETDKLTGNYKGSETEKYLGSGCAPGTETLQYQQFSQTFENVASNKAFSVYIVYAKDNTNDYGEDMAWVRNIAYVYGDAIVTAESSDASLGTVTLTNTATGENASGVKVAKGTSLTAKATLTDSENSKFYGWVNAETKELLSTDAVYVFPVTKEITIKAVFAAKDYYVASSEQGFYTDLAEAINAATSGTVRVLKNAELTNNATVAANVTLLLPFAEDDMTGYKLNESPNRVSKPTIGNLLCERLQVTVSNGVTLNVAGKVIVGGVRHSVEQDAQGQTSGDYANLIVNGRLNVASGGYLDINGLVSGNGTTELQSGGTTRMPYLILDYSGGTNTAALYDNNSFPFGNYATMNIRNTFVMHGGGKLIGSTSLYFWSSTTTQDVDLVGTTTENSGLILLASGSTLTANYYPTVRVNQEVGNIDLSPFGKTQITISGDAKFGGFRLSGYGSDKMYLNLPYTYDITLENGDFTMPYYYRVMPGANLTVASDATLLVKSSGGLQAVDGWQAADKSNKRYPSTSELKANYFAANGCLTLNGTLEIEAGAELGGIVSTTSDTATIKTGRGAKLNETFFGGSKNGYTDNYCEYELPARIWVNDELVKLLPGSTYQSTDGTATWTLESYTMNADRIAEETVTIDQTMYGNWGDPVTVTFDFNNDNVKVQEGTRTVYHVVYNAGVDTERLSTQVTAPVWKYNDKADNTFLGWFTAAEGGDKVELETATFNADTTLYAQWEAHEHDYTQDGGTVVTEPTCTEQGYTTYTCATCKEVTVGDYVNALGHDWKDANATTQVCFRCHETQAKENAATIVNNTYYAAKKGETDTSRFTVTPDSDKANTIKVVKTADGKGYTYIVEETVNDVVSTVTMTSGGSIDGTAYYTYSAEATTVTVTAVLKGDANLSGGKANATDAILIFNHFTKSAAYPLNVYAKCAADANLDGRTNATDAILVFNRFTKPGSFPLT